MTDDVQETPPTEVPAEDTAADDDPDAAADAADGTPGAPGAPRTEWTGVVAFGVLPAVALLLAAGAGVLKWQDSARRAAETGAVESVAAARDATAAILSYRAESVEQDLNAARDRLTGSFLDSYTRLIHNVVIPGAKQKKISTLAQVPAASSVSATERHAVALVFVDQTVTIGNGAPTNSASSVRVTLDKVDGRWLVSGFDPI